MTAPRKAGPNVVTIRPETSAVREVLVLAFPEEDVATVVENLRGTPGYSPEHSLVAEVEGAVVGHVMFSPVPIDTEGGVALL